MDLKARHDEVLEEIEKMNANGEDAAVESLKSEKEELQARLDDVNKIIAKASMNVEIDERIGQLQEEQKEIGQKVADQEQILYMLEEFIRFKLDKVSETINSHFISFSFGCASIYVRRTSGVSCRSPLFPHAPEFFIRTASVVV